MAIEQPCRECRKSFEISTGSGHAVRGDALHRDVECPHCGAQQRVNLDRRP